MSDLLTVGELTLDDVVVEDGHCDWKQVGGGALYSAIGARLWDFNPTISATVGADFPDQPLGELQAAGIDLSHVTRIARPSLGVWLLYERGGRRHQVEKDSGSSFAVLDAARAPLPLGRPGDALRGVHLAPQTAEGHLRALAELRDRQLVVTLDLMVEPFISAPAYTGLEALRGLAAFLPSEQEVRQLWGGRHPAVLATALRKEAHMEVLVIKRGARGVDVHTSEGDVRVPAVHAEALDPTGAGDAFCGGFLAGFVAHGDPVVAAMHGAVSASFVVETRGALDALRVLDREVAEQRLAQLRNRLGSPQ